MKPDVTHIQLEVWDDEIIDWPPTKVVRYPDRYADPRGKTMWQRVMKLIGEEMPVPWRGRACPNWRQWYPESDRRHISLF